MNDLVSGATGHEGGELRGERRCGLEAAVRAEIVRERPIDRARNVPGHRIQRLGVATEALAGAGVDEQMRPRWKSGADRSRIERGRDRSRRERGGGIGRRVGGDRPSLAGTEGEAAVATTRISSRKSRPSIVVANQPW